MGKRRWNIQAFRKTVKHLITVSAVRYTRSKLNNSILCVLKYRHILDRHKTCFDQYGFKVQNHRNMYNVINPCDVSIGGKGGKDPFVACLSLMTIDLASLASVSGRGRGGDGTLCVTDFERFRG